MTTTSIAIRALHEPGATSVRSAAADGTRTLFGHFAVWNQWAKIDSRREGKFMERVAPNAFDRTFAENGSRIRAIYDHGQDMQIQLKPLGAWRSSADKHGQAYEIDLIRSDYNDGYIIPAAEAGLLGASFRFSVTEDGVAVERPMRATSWNPDRLPERTITDADVHEFGPTPFPAYDGPSAGVRSLTDDYIDRLLNDPLFVARFTERAGLSVVERILASLPADGPSDEQQDPDVSADGHSRTRNQRRARALLKL